MSGQHSKYDPRQEVRNKPVGPVDPDRDPMQTFAGQLCTRLVWVSCWTSRFLSVNPVTGLIQKMRERAHFAAAASKPRPASSCMSCGRGSWIGDGIANTQGVILRESRGHTDVYVRKHRLLSRPDLCLPTRQRLHRGMTNVSDVLLLLAPI